jgi:hypothetical protein
MLSTPVAPRPAHRRIAATVAALGLVVALLASPGLPAQAAPAFVGVDTAPTARTTSDNGLGELAGEIDRVQADTDAEIAQNDVTLHSRSALAAAIGAARALVAGQNATVGQVDDARTALWAAESGLVRYTALTRWIADAAAVDASGFTTASRARLASALASGRALAASAATDPTAAITSEQVETAANDLIRAALGASTVPGDLSDALAEAEAWVSGAAAAGFTAYSVRAVGSAIDAARAELAEPAPADDTFRAVTAALQSALESRLERPATLRTALASHAALGADRLRFTAVSARDLDAAFAAALAVDDGAGATTASLEAAGSSLATAIGAVVSIVALDQAVRANDPSTLFAIAYTPASWASFVSARTASAALLARAADVGATPAVTAEQLASSTTTLTTARAGLAPTACGKTAAAAVADGSGVAGLPVADTTFVPEYVNSAPGAAPKTPSLLGPGLYVSVIDGMIAVSNKGGSLSFSAGQFGYVPNQVLPPALVPRTPGMTFSPPPSFQTPYATDCRPTVDTVDCEVRAIVADPLAAATVTDPPKKTYCNGSIASASLSTDTLDPSRARVSSLPTSNASAAEPGYRLVSVLAPAVHADGRLDASFALPADANSGDLYIQYTYNGTYYETAVAIEVVRAAAADVPTAAAGAAAARPGRAVLAQTGTDAGPLVGGAALLILAGVILAARGPRRSRRAA